MWKNLFAAFWGRIQTERAVLDRHAVEPIPGPEDGVKRAAAKLDMPWALRPPMRIRATGVCAAPGVAVTGVPHRRIGDRSSPLQDTIDPAPEEITPSRSNCPHDGHVAVNGASNLAQGTHRHSSSSSRVTSRARIAPPAVMPRPPADPGRL